MHVPRHAGALPAGVDPIPMPDTKREAEMLRCLLDARLYPRIRAEVCPESCRFGSAEATLHAERMFRRYRWG